MDKLSVTICVSQSHLFRFYNLISGIKDKSDVEIEAYGKNHTIDVD